MDDALPWHFLHQRQLRWTRPPASRTRVASTRQACALLDVGACGDRPRACGAYRYKALELAAAVKGFFAALMMGFSGRGAGVSATMFSALWSLKHGA